MLAAALLLAASAAAAPEPAAVTRLEARLSASATARRLFLAAETAPRREAHASGLPFAVDERGAAAPEIVVDLERLPDLPPGEAEAEYARALARAAIAAPLPLVEAEQAERVWTASILAELALTDAETARALRAAETRPASGSPVLSGAAAFLDLFERSPDAAYWSAEPGAPRGAARLTELEDLFALHAADLRALAAPPDGPYGVLGGRRYPAALVRAAWVLRAPGALARAREALGAYDVVGAAALHDDLVRFRRTPPAP
ncbi:MAG: hypothetical protein KGJ84_04780 [Elusimicrobia bacterium]|nr:hypothetical protein [Elusimicrobiota bacterium]